MKKRSVSLAKKVSYEAMMQSQQLGEFFGSTDEEE
jgi:hypothetical protein